MPSGEMAVPADAPKTTLEDVGRFGRAVAQGALLQYGDEAEAGVRSLFGTPYQEALADVRRKQEEFKQKYPTGAAAGEIAGAVGTSVIPGIGALRMLGQAPGLIRAAGAGALASAPIGAIEATGDIEGPASPGTYAREALEGGARAGGIGGAFGGAGNVVGRVAGPWASQAAQYLSERGIRLTPGQTLGGYAKRIEEASEGIPFVGQMLRTRQREGIEDLNRVAVNDAIEGLGEHEAVINARAAAHPDMPTWQLPRYAREHEPGREMLNEANQAVGRAFEEIVPQLRADIRDPGFLHDIGTIVDDLPNTERGAFSDRILDHISRADRNGTGMLRGRSVQDLLETMRDESSRYAKSQEPGTFSNELADAYGRMQELIRRHMEDSTPAEVVQAYGAVKNAYARLLPLERAASSVDAPGGVFTPSQLLSGVKGTDTSIRKRNFALGRGLDQQAFAEAGKEVMGPRIRDSGTAERTFMQNLPWAVAAGSYAMTPYLAATVPVALGSQSPWAHRAFQRAATFSLQTRATIRRAIERATGATAPAVASVEGAD
jgi:hypothetical protein